MMNNDDWDAVSSPLEDTDATDPWDAVSTPQPQRPKVRQSTRPAISRRFVWRALEVLLGVALVSGITFNVYRASVIRTANISATATAQAMATAHAVTTATALQRLYIYYTGGTPMIDDPLSNNNMGYAWGVLNLGGGDTCGFIGGVYHLSMTNSGYGWMYCVGRNIYLNNFVFRVQESIEKSGDAGILFGATANGFYRMDVNSQRTYTLYYRPTNKQDQVLLSGSSPLIKSGLNQVNTIALLVNNGELYFYVNNQFVVNTSLNISGLSYQTGTFGFFVANFGQPTDVVYSNLKIWSVP